MINFYYVQSIIQTMFHCRMCNTPFEGFTDKSFSFTCANCGFKEKFSASGKRLE